MSESRLGLKRKGSFIVDYEFKFQEFEALCTHIEETEKRFYKAGFIYDHEILFNGEDWVLRFYAVNKNGEA